MTNSAKEIDNEALGKQFSTHYEYANPYVKSSISNNNRMALTIPIKRKCFLAPGQFTLRAVVISGYYNDVYF